MTPIRRLRTPFHPRTRAADPGAGELVSVCGEVDYLTADQLRTRIETQAARHRRITLDLTGAAFYDQAALDALAEACASARAAGCRVVVDHPPANLPAASAPARRPQRPRLPRRPRTRALSRA
jgi:ABC-type transporter Mla MlaB component